ncbi:MAG: M48 family metallopeptidase [Hyphomicrobiaceae bacterium]|nr:M48 family metallopeptidase [Hyphomicrobiaceae bacterium]MCC0010943.1 M48 family metallopeptidase [Hyphomicrobiaceae bacterium]
MAKAGATAPSKLDTPALSDLGADVEVRHHPAARRLTLRISQTRRAVIVTVPMQCDLVEAGSFLHRNIDWVRERLGSIPEPIEFENGAVIPLRGEPYTLQFTDRRQRGLRVSPRHRACAPHPVQGDTAPNKDGATKTYGALEVAGPIENAPRRLTDWLLEEARRDLDQRVMHHTRNLGLKAKRITVRDQSSRWGSCSTTGTLSFSWRLVLAPPLILDYVAAHEVAHLKEMNHGPNFWALVRRTMPQMDEARQWLQIYGMDLHRYGPKTIKRS